MIELRAGSATDVGLVRSNNQDRLLMADPLYAVADGMGGAAAGEVASATAVNTLREVFEPIPGPTADDLVRSAETANRAVWDLAEANSEMRGMGTTLVALALVQENHLAIINIGDSRVYALHQGELRQVTEDHNLVAELVAQGRISEEEAEFHPRRNIMTRALGVDPDVPVDLFLEEAEPGDRYLLCSDGLPREVKDDHIAAILRHLRDPAEAAKELVDEAKRRGGSDNITVVVVDVVDASQKDKPVDATTVVPLTPVEAPEPSPEAGQPSKRGQRRRKPPQPDRPKARVVTVRVVAFVVLILLVLGGAAAAIAWYARSGYFVSLQGQNITIFKGRPGGVLWWKPTVARTTTTSINDIESRHIPDLQAGVGEPSLSAADDYVSSLVTEKQQAESAGLPQTPPAVTTTVPAQKPVPSTT
jgi:serine/threonine protein phosphatase PrpC